MNEAYTLLKQVANKPKAVAKKDESSLFCELLCLKLRALDNETREVAMHEIHNVMFNLKRPTISPTYWSQPHIYQQPGYSGYLYPNRSQTPDASSNDGSVISVSTPCPPQHNTPTVPPTPQTILTNVDESDVPVNSTADFFTTFKI